MRSNVRLTDWFRLGRGVSKRFNDQPAVHLGTVDSLAGYQSVPPPHGTKPPDGLSLPRAGAVSLRLRKWVISLFFAAV
jgi:hypothetical protein